MNRFALLLLIFVMTASSIPSQESSRSDPPFISSLKLAASPVFPIGSTGDMYRLGGGGDFSVHHKLERLEFLNFFVGAGFRATPLLDQSSSLLFTDISAGAGLEFEIIPRLHFEALVSGGAYMGNLLEPEESGYGAVFAGKASIGYDLSGQWRLGMGTTYRSFPGLANHISGDLVVTYRTDFYLEDPFGTASLDLEPLYPVLIGYYNGGRPIGRLNLTNIGRADWQKMHVAFDARGLTRGKTDVPASDTVETGTTASIGLLGQFADIADKRNLSGESDAVASIVFRYKGWPQDRTVDAVVSVHEADFAADPATAAVFVASKDPIIREWSRASVNIDSEVTSELNPALVISAALLDALSITGFRSETSMDDAWPAITGAIGAVDRFPFPRQTLIAGEGDRSESAILIAASLESAGIPAGLAVIDGELWPAAALGEGEDRIAAEYARPQDLVIINGVGWAVLDTVGDPEIIQALEQGAEAWRGAGSDAVLIACREAWESYPQTGYSQDPVEISLPDTQRLTGEFAESVDSLVRWEIAARRLELEEAISSQPRNTDLLNRLGALLARYGLRDEAATWFDRVLLLEDDPRTLVNMGNIEYLKGDLVRARTYYNQAARVDPFNPYVLLGVARVSFEQENFGSSRDAYSKLEIVDPDLADRFSILTSTGPSALQQALDSELRRVVFWLD